MQIFCAVTEGLAHAHSKGIIHRDLKPSNIILVKDERGNEVPKIVDFGIAKRQTVDAKLTQTGEVFGTPLYMSPEQCTGGPVDERSDVYSLGCVMFEALTGEPAFGAANAILTIFRHVNETAPPLRKVGKGIQCSSAIEEVVAGCLDKNPTERIQSAESLNINLARAAQGKRPLANDVARKHKRTVRSVAKYSTILIVSMFILIGIWFVGAVLTALGPTGLRAPKYVALASQSDQEIQKGHYQKGILLVEQAVAESRKSNIALEDSWTLYHFVYNAYAYAGDYKKASLAAGKLAGYAKQLGKQEDLAIYGIKAAAGLIDTQPAQARSLMTDSLAASEAAGKRSVTVVTELERAGSRLSREKHFAESIVVLETARQIGMSNKDTDASTLFDIDEWLLVDYAKINDLSKAPAVMEHAEILAADLQLDPARRMGFQSRLATLRKRLHH